MLENSTYSVITPEGAAAILWKDSGKAKEAAEAMKITAADLKELGVIYEIIPEARGGAHRNILKLSENIVLMIRNTFEQLNGISKDE
ncbi:acetyl-CoA carboxylase carboxyl transferase subunit alpha, partial [Acinetobacter baumannii]